MSTGNLTPAHNEDWTALPVRSDFELDTALPQFSDEPLLHTAMDTRVAGDLVNYSAHYSITPGNMLREMQSGGGKLRQVPTELVAETVEQRLQVALPVPEVSPVKLGLSSREHSRVTMHGEKYHRSNATNLRWSPGPIDLNMRWMEPREQTAAGPLLNCVFQTHLRLDMNSPNARDDASLNLQQRNCGIDAPGRGLTANAGLSVENWGVSWRQNQGALHNALRAQHFSLRSDYSMPQIPASAYEFGFLHRRSVQSWLVRADIAVHQFGEIPETQLASGMQWTADLALRRDLGGTLISAHWMYNRDPLWFLPIARPIGKQNFLLKFDFNALLNELLPQLDTQMVASMAWGQQPSGSSTRRLNWHLSMLW